MPTTHPAGKTMSIEAGGHRIFDVQSGTQPPHGRQAGCDHDETLVGLLPPQD